MFDIIVLISRFLFLFYILYFLLEGFLFILSERGITETDAHAAITKQHLCIVFMHVTAFLILAYTPGEHGSFPFAPLVLAVGGAGLLFMVGVYLLLRRVYRDGDPLVWNGMFFLLDVGLIMLQRLDPASAERQLIWFFIGAAAVLLIPVALKIFPKFEKLTYAYLTVGFVALALPFIFGERTLGAVNWINIGGLNFQPSEIVKFLFVFYLACVFRKNLTLRQMIFPTAASAAFVCILAAQNDFGGALIFFMTFMVIMYISSGRAVLFIGGIAAAGGAVFLIYKFLPQVFSHVQTRIAAWQNPWADVSGGGYQIVQSLFAIGTWGFFGSGLTRGMPGVVPVVTSDFIFAAVCEEMGSVFGVALIGVFIMLFYRGAHISLRAHRRFYGALAAGFTAMLAFQTFLILGGDIKLIPLTGVTLPFVSYGGSSIVVSAMMLGLLQWVFGASKKMEEE